MTCGPTPAGGWHCAGTNCAQGGRVCLLTVADPEPTPGRLLRPLTVSAELISGPVGGNLYDRALADLRAGFSGRPAAAHEVGHELSLAHCAPVNTGGVMADLRRAIDLLESVPPVTVTGGFGGPRALESLREKLPTRRPTPLEAMLGVPLYLDEELPPNVVEFRDRAGKVVSRFVVPDAG